MTGGLLGITMTIFTIVIGPLQQHLFQISVMKRIFYVRDRNEMEAEHNINSKLSDVKTAKIGGSH